MHKHWAANQEQWITEEMVTRWVAKNYGSVRQPGLPAIEESDETVRAAAPAIQDDVDSTASGPAQGENP